MAHADSLSIDRSRVAVGGDSAGGLLALATCLAAREQVAPKIATLLLLCPKTNVRAETLSRAELATGYFLETSTILWASRLYAGSESAWQNVGLAPANADLRGLPPTIVHTAEFDPLRDEGEGLVAALKEGGVSVTHTRHNGMIHHFYGIPAVIPEARAAVAQIGLELRRALDLAST
jgi:acetyl esterase